MYDLLLPAHEKDFLKLRFVYDSIIQNITGFEDFYCITNVKVPNNLRITGINYYLDEDVIDFDFSVFQGVIKKRTGWYRQQFVKLFQNVTGDEYLITEADNLYNQKVNVIKNGKPVFLLGKDQNNQPYYDITQKLLGYGREYNYSFINEVMYIKREYVKELVALTHLNQYGFFELFANELNRTQETSGSSDYDLYGNFVAKYHKDDYVYRHVETVVKAKYHMWSASEIEKYITEYKNTKNVMLKMHTWI
jgi:hypothetical protein